MNGPIKKTAPTTPPSCAPNRAKRSTRNSQDQGFRAPRWTRCPRCPRAAADTTPQAGFHPCCSRLLSEEMTGRGRGTAKETVTGRGIIETCAWRPCHRARLTRMRRCCTCSSRTRRIKGGRLWTNLCAIRCGTRCASQVCTDRITHRRRRRADTLVRLEEGGVRLARAAPRTRTVLGLC